MEENKISSSKEEIYNKLLNISENYFDGPEDFLKTGLFGYITESIAMMIRDSSYHKSMLYNESFLNTAIIPKSVYNWAKMFNINVQKAQPAYADIKIYVNTSEIEFENDKYTISRNNPILAGEIYFSLEHSIILTRNAEKNTYSAQYDTDEFTTTSFQDISSIYLPINTLPTEDGNGKIITIHARAYQYIQNSSIRQVSTNNFLNNIQIFTFPDQFCGANLFYLTGDKRTEIKLEYSDLYFSSENSALYNLIDSNKLEVSFKTGRNYFSPGPNSKLEMIIYTTKGADIESTKYSGDAIMINSDIPLTINFESDIIGGKNMPSLSRIKQDIINEISTRNTITTQSDLNLFFENLTQITEEINDGKFKFIKKRDDILKRVYNAYLLLRDNTDNDGSTTVVAGDNYLSACVPTNTINGIFSNQKLSTGNSFYNINIPYPTFEISGANIQGEIDVNKQFYICPFHLFINTVGIHAVKYIYNLVDQTSELAISEKQNINEKTVLPRTIRILRSFADSSYKAESCYHFTLETITNFDISEMTPTIKWYTYLSQNGGNSETTKVEAIITNKKSSDNGDNSYNTTIEFDVNIADNEFEIGNQGEDKTFKLKLEGDQSISDTSNFFVDLIVDEETFAFKSTDKLSFFKQMDDIMQSDIKVSSTNDFQILGIPVVHSSFFFGSGNNSLRKEGFSRQLFTYINLLKENTDKLETSTFFSLKFFNTYGISRYYNTNNTNLNLKMEITTSNLNHATYIRAYIRKLIDKMNETDAGVSISTLITMLQVHPIFGKEISYINFISLNNSFNQHINKLTTNTTKEELLEYTPEWLNLDADYIEKNITFKEA